MVTWNTFVFTVPYRLQTSVFTKTELLSDLLISSVHIKQRKGEVQNLDFDIQQQNKKTHTAKILNKEPEGRRNGSRSIKSHAIDESKKEGIEVICTFPWRIIQQSLESLCSETSLKLKTFDMAFQEPCKSSRFCRNGWMGEETKARKPDRQKERKKARKKETTSLLNRSFYTIPSTRFLQLAQISLLCSAPTSLLRIEKQCPNHGPRFLICRPPCLGFSPPLPPPILLGLRRFRIRRNYD